MEPHLDGCVIAYKTRFRVYSQHWLTVDNRW